MCMTTIKHFHCGNHTDSFLYRKSPWITVAKFKSICIKFTVNRTLFCMILFFFSSRTPPYGQSTTSFAIRAIPKEIKAGLASCHHAVLGSSKALARKFDQIYPLYHHHICSEFSFTDRLQHLTLHFLGLG